MRATRRRFIAISAAAAGLPLLPVAAVASPSDARLHVWRGSALGADAVLQIHHPDATEAERLVAMALAEVERLERIFSLYRPDSALSRLNRDGALASPPADLVTLLAQSSEFGRLTDGAFDVTIQPLWRLYADHFSRPDADPAGPSRAAVEQALQRIDYRAVAIEATRIRFGRPGMGVTLNGVAQGYVTDRVVDLLRREGIDNSLIDIGEIRAMGARADGAAWLVGIEDPVRPEEIAERVPIRGKAVATSGGYGLRFDPAGKFNHLIDPHGGGSAQDVLAVSVIADTATVADAMSTAFSVMPLQQAAKAATALRLETHIALPNGSRLRWTS